jgi:spore coat protein CotH
MHKLSSFYKNNFEYKIFGIEIHRQISLILFLSSFPILLFAQNPGDNVFAGIQVHTIKINFNQASYWDSLTYYYNQGNEQYMIATVTLDGETIDSCGVRLKGNSSYSHPNNKKPMKISFDEYLDDQRYDGLKGIFLNNCYNDPSFLREKIHLDFCHDAGIPAPRASYAMVYINDVIWGLYSLVEPVDKKFLSTWYGNKSGNLYKAVDAFGQSGTSAKLSDFQWRGSTSSAYTSYYELKTDDSSDPWTDLVTFIDTLYYASDIAYSLPTKLNIANFDRAIAADLLFANLDSYAESGRNFYAYFNPSTAKLEWIIWDVSMSFGNYQAQNSNSTGENLSVTYINSITSRPLFGRILNNATLKNNYLASFYKLFSNYFSQTKMFAHIDSIVTVIDPYVNADTKKQYTYAQFQNNVTSDISVSNGNGGGGNGGGNNSQKVYGVKSFITARLSNLKSQFANLSIDTSTTVSAGDIVINEFMAKNKKTITDPAGEYDDWIELYNNTNSNISLSGFYLSDSFTQPTKWQFPDTASIPAKGYLLVWADEDTGQAGYHASFKLSDSGEEIMLSNANLNVIDSVTFGQQTADYSSARIPNGTGSFVITDDPTPGTVNSSVSAVETTGKDLPKNFLLSQNYPNPFNPSTTISFSIPNQSFVRLEVFDILGKSIATLISTKLSSGYYQATWKANVQSSGIYFYRLSAQSVDGKNYTQVKKMLLLK